MATFTRSVLPPQIKTLHVPHSVPPLRSAQNIVDQKNKLWGEAQKIEKDRRHFKGKEDLKIETSILSILTKSAYIPQKENHIWTPLQKLLIAMKDAVMCKKKEKRTEKHDLDLSSIEMRIVTDTPETTRYINKY